MRTLIATFCVALAWSAAASAQPLACEIGGAHVNPSSGSTTAGKTGIMRCRDSDARLQREEELRDGKFVGMRAFYERDGGKRVGNVNEKGNRDGLQREFWPDGTLKREETAVDGSTIGVVRTFYASGKPQRIAHVAAREDAVPDNAVEYHENGQFARLSCAPKIRLKETEGPCGFPDKAQSGIYSARGELVARETYEQGRLRERITLRNGKMQANLEQTDAMRIERSYFPESGTLRLERRTALDPDGRPLRLREGLEKEFTPSGQLLRETQWRAGLAARDGEWYQNGQKKLDVARTVIRDNGVDRVQSDLRHYWDNGKLRSEEQRLANGNALPGRVVGTQRQYREDGSLRQEGEFNAGGWRERLREFDQAGNVTSDEAFFEDGSRKSQSR